MLESDLETQLQKLKDLMDKGLITEQDYNSKKQKLLDKEFTAEEDIISKNQELSLQTTPVDTSYKTSDNKFWKEDTNPAVFAVIGILFATIIGVIIAAVAIGFDSDEDESNIKVTDKSIDNIGSYVYYTINVTNTANFTVTFDITAKIKAHNSDTILATSKNENKYVRANETITLTGYWTDKYWSVREPYELKVDIEEHKSES